MAKDEGAAVETPPAKGAEDAGKETAPKSTGNAWDDVMAHEVPKIRDATLGELSPHPETTEKGEKADKAEKGKTEEKGKEKPAGKAPAPKPGDKEAEGDEDEGEEEPEGKEGEEDDEGEDEQPEKGATRYSVVAEGGDEFEFEALPKGAKIVFKAAKQRVEVTSMDELVAMAQQGATLRQVEGTYTRKLADSNKTIKQLAARITAADKAFQAILEDDEALEKYRARAAKLKDPEYREGQEAKRKLAQKEEQDQAASEAEMEKMSDEFWGEAKTHYEAKLEEYPTLAAEDFPDVVRDFWGNFVAHRAELVSATLEEAGTDELTQEQLAAIDEEAVAWLTEENFEATMKALHAKAERRSGRTGAGGNGKRKIAATEEEADKAEAERHNKHVDDKLRQRDTRTLKGKGAPPGAGGKEQKRPSTWADHMAGIHEEFDSAKKSPVAD
jgi:hypothetical protein